MTKISLCRRRGCCPTVEVSDKTYTIEDDDGNKVKLNEENMKNLTKVYFESE